MKVVVTGANGFVGRRLLAQLIREGNQVSVLSRMGSQEFPAGVRVISGDLTREDCPLDVLMADCEVVFHCAGEIRDTRKMRALHVDGTERLLQAVLKRASVTGMPIHWVQLSSVGAYGPPADAARSARVVTEETPTRPVGEYEVTKTQADELLIQASQSGLLSYSIVRPSNIIAANMPNASVRALGAMVRKRLFFYIGSRGAIATYVHVDDVVETLVRCAKDDRAKGEIFNLSNDCLLEEVIDSLAAAVGVRRPWLRLPESFVRFATHIIGKILPFPLTQERISALVMRTRYPYSKLARELGFTPRVAVPMVMGEVALGAPVLAGPAENSFVN